MAAGRPADIEGPRTVRKLTLQIIHGTNKFDIKLELRPDEEGDILNVKHLMTEVFKITSIPFDKQRLIYKGRSLKDEAEQLHSIGLQDGSKIMLVGKKPQTGDEDDVKTLHQVDVEVEKLSKKLNDVTHELDGVHRGFLDKKKRNETIQLLEKRMAAISENLMKQLEQLDSLQFDSDNHGSRTKRKSLVNKIQSLMDRVDGLLHGVNDMVILWNSQ